MRNSFKSLVPILLIISMVFTLGVKSIESANDVITVETIEEKNLGDTPKEKLEVEESKVFESKPEEAKVEETKAGETKEESQSLEKPKVEEAKPKETKPEESKSEYPKTEGKDPGEEAKESKKDEKNDSEEEKSEDEVEEDEELEEEKELQELEELRVVLSGARIMIEETITLGSEKDSNDDNYMEVTGGDGNYGYEWRISGEEETFSRDRNPTVSPTSTTNYELIVKDSEESEAKTSMTVIVEKGSIEIRNEIKGLNFGDANRKFDVFISGPDERLYTISLKNGESKTLKNLKKGKYTISTIIPMNYKLLGISNKIINISLDDIDHKTTIRNIRTNNSWFYSESVF